MTRLTLTKVWIVLGAAGGGVLGAASLAGGCGGDDNGAGGQPDTGTVDGTNPDAPGTEGSSSAESGSQPDAGSPGDSSMSPETSTTPDANDFMDVGDVQIDAPALDAFPAAVLNASCSHLMQCCLSSQDLGSASQWNQNGDGGCVSAYSAGGDFGINTHGQALASGNVGYDASAAAAC